MGPARREAGRFRSVLVADNRSQKGSRPARSAPGGLELTGRMQDPGAAFQTGANRKSADDNVPPAVVITV